MKATRHNGRSGKHGTYDAKHNDRRFDVENKGILTQRGRNLMSIGTAIRVIVCRMMKTKEQDLLLPKWRRHIMLKNIQIMWTDRMKEIERQGTMTV